MWVSQGSFPGRFLRTAWSTVDLRSLHSLQPLGIPNLAVLALIWLWVKTAEALLLTIQHFTENICNHPRFMVSANIWDALTHGQICLSHAASFAAATLDAKLRRAHGRRVMLASEQGNAAVDAEAQPRGLQRGLRQRHQLHL